MVGGRDSQIDNRQRNKKLLTEGGTEGGTEAGTEGGTEGGTEAGTEAGTEGGTEAGTEGGTEGGRCAGGYEVQCTMAEPAALGSRARGLPCPSPD